MTDKLPTRPRRDKGKGREESKDDDEQGNVEEVTSSDEDEDGEETHVYHHEIFDRLVAVANANGAHRYGMRPTIYLLPC